MKDANMESYIIKNMILRNENVDRVEKGLVRRSWKSSNLD